MLLLREVKKKRVDEGGVANSLRDERGILWKNIYKTLILGDNKIERISFLGRKSD